MINPFYCIVILAFATQTALADPRQEEQISTITDKYAIDIGVFYVNSDSSMNVANTENGGTFPIDFEDQLLLPEEQYLPYFEFTYAFNQRHNLFIDWKSLDRQSSQNAITQDFILEDIDGKDYLIEVGAELNTELNIDILRIGYGYDIWQGTNYTLGVSVGLHTMFIETVFNGTINTCLTNSNSSAMCDNTIATPEVVDDSYTAPLPNIGLYGDYEFYPDFTFSAHAQYFSVKYDDIDGSLVDIRLGVEANISNNWSLKLAYNYYDVDVTIEKQRTINNNEIRNYHHNINYSFTGPMFAVSYSF